MCVYLNLLLCWLVHMLFHTMSNECLLFLGRLCSFLSPGCSSGRGSLESWLEWSESSLKTVGCSIESWTRYQLYSKHSLTTGGGSVHFLFHCLLYWKCQGKIESCLVSIPSWEFVVLWKKHFVCFGILASYLLNVMAQQSIAAVLLGNHSPSYSSCDD